MSQKSLLQQFNQLEEKRKALMATLAHASVEKISTPPAPGKWSPLQVVAHLLKGESASMAYIYKKLQYRTRIPVITWRTKLRLWLLKVFFMSPIKIKAPAPVADIPADQDFEILKLDWIQKRIELKEMLENFPPEMESRAVFKHPFGGRINMAQTLDFFDFHLDRHRKQIDRILKS